MRNVFSQYLIAQNQSAIAPSASSIEDTIRNMVADTLSQQLADMQKALDEHSKHNALAEISTRQLTLTQRENDKWYLVNVEGCALAFVFYGSYSYEYFTPTTSIVTIVVPLY